MTIEELDSDTRKAIEELLEYQGVPAISTEKTTIGPNKDRTVKYSSELESLIVVENGTEFQL